MVQSRDAADIGYIRYPISDADLSERIGFGYPIFSKYSEIFGVDRITDTNDFKIFGADRTPDTYIFQIFGADRISDVDFSPFFRSGPDADTYFLIFFIFGANRIAYPKYF